MLRTNACPYIYAALLLCLLSIAANGINFFTTHYPGNNYFPPNIIKIGLPLLLTYTGCLIQFGRNSTLTNRVKEIIMLLLILLMIAFAANAVQYTPFPTIDQTIVNIEQTLHINTSAIVSWTNHQPLFLKILDLAYDSLAYQMAYIPLALIMIKRHAELHEYYFLLLFSTIIGFVFYYFFPTTAPASILDNPYFASAQHATGLKFSQIHQHIQPTTLDGGLVALPSFHVIWAWFSLYLIRSWPIPWMLLLPINLLLVLSCVLLGWHYPMDILGGLVVILFSHAAYGRISALSFRREKASPAEHLSFSIIDNAD